MVWKRIKLAFCVDWEEKKKEMEFKQCQALTNSCNEKKSGLRIPLIHPQRKKKKYNCCTGGLLIITTSYQMYQ